MGMQAPGAVSIFKRGLKAELFDISAGDNDDAVLKNYLDELCAVWSKPRSG